MRWRVVEMVAFGVVFTAGVVLSMLAVAGPGAEPAVTAGPGPQPGPVATSPGAPLPPSIPPPETGAPFPQVEVTRATSEVTPPASGCTTRVAYVWDVDPSDVAEGARALIRLDGPSESGDYRRPVRRGQVRFSVVVGPVGVWTAELISIDGRPAFPTPLPVTLNLPGC